MRYKLYGWTASTYMQYNNYYGMNEDELYYNERNCPFRIDLENDEISLTECATLIKESEDENTLTELRKTIIESNKYREVEIWDSEEEIWML